MSFWQNFFLFAQDWIVNFSYLGIFLVSLTGTSTILLPFPIYLIIFFSEGLGLNPFLVGIIAGIGSALGEATGYALGYGGRKLLKKKYKKWFRIAEKWFKKNGFVTIFIFALTPLPDDIVGIIGGMTKYEIKKFFLASALGKIILCLLIAYSGHLIVPYFKEFTGMLVW